MVSAKIVSSSILRRFQILPSAEGPKSLDDIKTVAGISASPKGGSPVRVERRRAFRRASAASACSPRG